MAVPELDERGDAQLYKAREERNQKADDERQHPCIIVLARYHHLPVVVRHLTRVPLLVHVVRVVDWVHVEPLEPPILAAPAPPVLWGDAHTTVALAVPIAISVPAAACPPVRLTAAWVPGLRSMPGMGPTLWHHGGASDVAGRGRRRGGLCEHAPATRAQGGEGGPRVRESVRAHTQAGGGAGGRTAE